MSDPHAEEPLTTGPHGATDHGVDPGHEHDDHAHATAEALGPIDWPAYGAGLLGLGIGLAMAAVFAVAVGLV